MKDEERQFKTFNEMTKSSNLDIIPTAYTMHSPIDDAYYELSNDELEALSLSLDDIQSVQLIHAVPHKRLIRIRAGDKHYILLDSEKMNKEYQCYALFQKYGIKTLPVYAIKQTEEWSAILMEDLHRSDRWRLASQRDMSDYDVGEALGHWYRQFHDKGVVMLRDEVAYIFERVYDELTTNTLTWTAKELELTSYGVFQLASQYIDEIKAKARQFEETVLYNDFYYSNLAVAKDSKEATMFDFHLVSRGYRYSDVRNVLYSLEESAREGFLKSYGSYDEREKTFDDVLEPFCAMLLVAKWQKLPKWVKPIIQQVKNGKLENRIKILLQHI